MARLLKIGARIDGKPRILMVAAPLGWGVAQGRLRQEECFSAPGRQSGRGRRRAAAAVFCVLRLGGPFRCH